VPDAALSFDFVPAVEVVSDGLDRLGGVDGLDVLDNFDGSIVVLRGMESLTDTSVFPFAGFSPVAGFEAATC
jgi:hypothetical protein